MPRYSSFQFSVVSSQVGPAWCVEARVEFERALQIDPAYSQAREHLERIRPFVQPSQPVR